MTAYVSRVGVRIFVERQSSVYSRLQYETVQNKNKSSAIVRLFYLVYVTKMVFKTNILLSLTFPVYLIFLPLTLNCKLATVVMT